jgi:integrase
MVEQPQATDAIELLRNRPHCANSKARLTLPSYVKSLERAHSFIKAAADFGAELVATAGAGQPSQVATREVVAGFIESKRNDVAEESLATYIRVLKTFAHTSPILPTEPESIERYIAQRGKPSTRRHLYTVFCQLYKWASQRLGVVNAMSRVKRPAKGKGQEAGYLTPEQAKALLEAIKDDRERGIIYLTLGEGFRRSEVTRVNVEDIKDDRILVHGKEREESMPLLPEVRDVLLKVANGRTGGEPVFVSQTTGKRLSPGMVAVVVGGLFKRAQITDIKQSPHTLRHTYCTLMQTDGCDRYSVELLMRHRTPNTTDIYSHQTVEQRLQLLRPKLERYSPLRQLNGNHPIRINSVLPSKPLGTEEKSLS